ncbi:unnamed protein product [Ilex paraguariensis]|uniref:Pentatricopeptide repeat-containing protein n=1 Tax=Ilex paraguariensis TaxID=185542 RepID=A0ABC8R162_9AQUA
MLIFRQFTHKTPKSATLLCNTSRFLTTQSPHPFPDQPNSSDYDDLINAAGRERDFAAVRHLLNKRVRDGCFNTTKTFKFISTDLSVLDDLLQSLSLLDRGFPRKSAHDSLVGRLSKLQRTDEALRLADIMVKNDYGANACTFHPILNALTRQKRMDEAWRVMELIRENGITPDVTAYNYLLTAYCFAGDVMSAARVLTRMVEEGMEADTRTYDALVLGACRADKVEGALVVLRRMVIDGVPALYSTHAHVIGSLLKLGHYAQAVELVMSYGGRDKGLDTENFGLLANRLINLRRFDDAKFVLEEMRKMGLAMGYRLKDFYDLHMNN